MKPTACRPSLRFSAICAALVFSFAAATALAQSTSSSGIINPLDPGDPSLAGRGFCCVPPVGGSSCLGPPEYSFVDERSCVTNNTNPANPSLGTGIVFEQDVGLYPPGTVFDTSYAQCSNFCGLVTEFAYCINRARDPNNGGDAFCATKSEKTSKGIPYVNAAILDTERGYLQKNDCMSACPPIANTCEGCPQMESIALLSDTAFNEQFCEQNPKCVWELNDKGKNICMPKPECNRQYKACCETKNFMLLVAASDGPSAMPDDVAMFTKPQVEDPLSHELVPNASYRDNLSWLPGFVGWNKVNLCPGVRQITALSDIAALAEQCVPQYMACCDPIAKKVTVTELAQHAPEPASITPLLDFFFPKMTFIVTGDNPEQTSSSGNPFQNDFYACAELPQARFWPGLTSKSGNLTNDDIDSLYNFTIACGVVPHDPGDPGPMTCDSCRTCNGQPCFGSDAQQNCTMNPRCDWITLPGEEQTVTMCRPKPTHPDCRSMPLECHDCLFTYHDATACNAAPEGLCAWDSALGVCDQNPAKCSVGSSSSSNSAESIVYDACNRTVNRTSKSCYLYDSALANVTTPAGTTIPKAKFLLTHTVTFDPSFAGLTACTNLCKNIEMFAYCCEKPSGQCVFHQRGECVANKAVTFGVNDDGSPAGNCFAGCQALVRP